VSTGAAGRWLRGSPRARRSNYERLVALKNIYDPTNLFRHNQNIKPTV
jgi:FAD/FMN-containing dehydrogenase